MKALKKLSILMVLCMTVVLVFSACGPKGGSATPTKGEEPQTEPVNEGYPVPTLSGDTYTNEAINLKMTVPSTWALYTKEQLTEEYNNGATEPAIGETLYEAYAQLTTGGDNVSIIVQNATGQTSTITSMGIKAFTELISDGIQEALEGAGASDIKFGLIDIDFPLDDFACIGSTCSLQGTPIVQKQVVFLNGNYLYTITVTAFNEADANAVLGFFSKVK